MSDVITYKEKFLFSNSDEDDSEPKKKQPIFSKAAFNIMKKMGFKEGEGLGSQSQGRKDIIEASNQKGRRGLGQSGPQGIEEAPDANWEFSEEEVNLSGS